MKNNMKSKLQWVGICLILTSFSTKEAFAFADAWVGINGGTTLNSSTKGVTLIGGNLGASLGPLAVGAYFIEGLKKDLGNGITFKPQLYGIEAGLMPLGKIIQTGLRVGSAKTVVDYDTLYLKQKTTSTSFSLGVFAGLNVPIIGTNWGISADLAYYLMPKWSVTKGLATGMIGIRYWL
jgi:hypothetical protein